MVKSKLRKKYMGPEHLWQMKRIKEESQLRKKYGYKNKKEIWKVQSTLRNFRAQARRLIPLKDKQAELEKQQLISKLAALGIIKEDSHIEDILALDIRDLLERRLQTILLKKKMANSIKQARQFITHGHIKIGENKITSPSYLVRISEESQISFSENSSIFSEMHPERVAAREKRESTETMEPDITKIKANEKLKSNKEDSKKKKVEEKKVKVKEKPKEKKEEKKENKKKEAKEEKVEDEKVKKEEGSKEEKKEDKKEEESD